MNRLTRQISLILISSSLVLNGCHREVVEEARQCQEGKPWQEGDPPPPPGAPPLRDCSGTTYGTAPGTSSGTAHGIAPHTGTHYGYRSRPVFVPIPLGGRSGPAVGRGTTPGRTTSGASSIGGSSRGGFGSAAHGVAS